MELLALLEAAGNRDTHPCTSLVGAPRDGRLRAQTCSQIGRRPRVFAQPVLDGRAARSPSGMKRDNLSGRRIVAVLWQAQHAHEPLGWEPDFVCDCSEACSGVV